MRFFSRVLRCQLKLLKPITTHASISATRKAQDLFGRLGARAHTGEVVFAPVTFDKFSACLITPRAVPSQPGCAILYLHGGGYVAGSIEYACGFGSVLSATFGQNVFCPAYRLAPENPFPAALEDVLTAYRYLLQSGVRQVAVVGESAGGGLIFSLIQRLKQLELPLPYAVWAISPWVDLQMLGPSLEQNQRRDPTLTKRLLSLYRDMYAKGQEDHPLVSPILASLNGFPPTLIHVGGDEILLDNARSLNTKLREANVQSILHIVPKMWHAFVLYGTAEGWEALKIAQRFLKEHRLNGSKRIDIS